MSIERFVKCSRLPVSAADAYDWHMREGAFRRLAPDWVDDLHNLDKVDWKIMAEKYWGNTPEDTDRKRRRQAEFLVHSDFPWELIDQICVCDSAAKKTVLEMIKSCSHQPEVKVMESWYY